MADIRLWLDFYDDIYSDFDSRNYLKRRISEDFLHELHMERKLKNERISDIQLFLPNEKRDEQTEQIIISSLKSFFRDQFQNCNLLYKKKLNAGIGWLLAGLLAMAINSYIAFKTTPSLLLVTAKVLLEPAGWFLVWVAFDLLFYDLTEIRKDREFSWELMRANIHFKSS